MVQMNLFSKQKESHRCRKQTTVTKGERINWEIGTDTHTLYSIQKRELIRRLESPWNSKEIIQVNPKGNQPWIFIGRTDAEAEAPKFWPPDVKSRLTGKDPDAGKDWRQEKMTTEGEMDGWHHWLNGHEFEQTLGVGDGQGSSVCCSSWGHKESDTTEGLNNCKA